MLRLHSGCDVGLRHILVRRWIVERNTSRWRVKDVSGWRLAQILFCTQFDSQDVIIRECTLMYPANLTCLRHEAIFAAQGYA